MNNETKITAAKLADLYLSRLESGYYKSFRQMHDAILKNIVNNEYSRHSNYFVDCLWSRINAIKY